MTDKRPDNTVMRKSNSSVSSVETLSEATANEIVSSVVKGAQVLLEAADKSGGVGRDLFDELLAEMPLDSEAREAILLLANRQYNPPNDE